MIDATASYGTVAALLTVVSLFNHMGELVQQLETLSSTLQRWTSEPRHGFLCVVSSLRSALLILTFQSLSDPPHTTTTTTTINLCFIYFYLSCPSLSGTSELRHNQMEIIVSGSELHFYTYFSGIYLCGSSKGGIVSKLVGGCSICPCFHGRMKLLRHPRANKEEISTVSTF